MQMRLRNDKNALRFSSVCLSQNQNNYTSISSNNNAFSQMLQSISRDQVNVTLTVCSNIFAILRNTLYILFRFILIFIPITSLFEIYKLCVCVFFFCALSLVFCDMQNSVYFTSSFCAYEKKRKMQFEKNICSWHIRISEAFTENASQTFG